MPADLTPFMTPDALLNHWQGHRRVTRRVIDAFQEDRLFSFSIGGMRPFGELAMEMSPTSSRRGPRCTVRRVGSRPRTHRESATRRAVDNWQHHVPRLGGAADSIVARAPFGKKC